MKNKGITLVALVVTIVVLLILAGVSISLVLGQNGLISNAKEAKEKTQLAEKDELKHLDEVNEYIDSQEEEYIKDDDLPENQDLKSFITEWTVEAGDTIVLPIYEMQDVDDERGEIETYFNYDFTVDYGDGTVLTVKSFDDENRKHTYANAGTYTVKINGKCESISFENALDSADCKLKITKLVQWGVIGAKHYDFSECKNLKGTIPLPAKNSFKYVESFRLLFYYCTGLTGEIPKDLFKYAPNVLTMANVFNFTTGLTGTIPEKLFANCTKVTNFRFIFASSNVSGEIPEKLFISNPEVVNFDGVFRQAYAMTGLVPKNLFKYNNKIQTLRGLFTETNLSTEEIYFSSNDISQIGDIHLKNGTDGSVKVYVPKDSITEQTFKNRWGANNDKLIIENYTV